MSKVVLLHGLGGSARETWRDTGWIDILTDEGHTVLAPDLLGHGEAEKPHNPDAYSGLRAPAERMVGADSGLVGVGFSLGARVLLEWALDEPQRFDRLCLIGLADNLFRPWDPTEFASTLENIGTETSERSLHSIAVTSDSSPFVTRLVELITRSGDPLAIAALLRHRGNDALAKEALTNLTMKVLLIFGESDPIGDPIPLRDALPNAELRTIRRADHFSTTTKFETIELVSTFSM